MGPAALLLAALVSSSAPYVRSHTTTDPASHCLWWPTSTITWQQNSVGNSATGAAAFIAVTNAFAIWQMAMEDCGSVTLTEGARISTRRIGFDPDGVNSNLMLFRFSSCTKKVPATAACWADGSCGNAFDCWGHASTLLGVTTVSYDTQTGRIFDADIELNAANNVYTTVNEPPCSGVLNQTCVATDVRNTMVHEIGHFLGLGHAEGRTSTMNATSSIGDLAKRTLDPGTKAFVCEVYTKNLAPKDCVIDASTDVLGPPAEVKTSGCASVSAGPSFVVLMALAALWTRRRAAMGLVAVLATSAQATTVLALDLPRLTHASDAVVHAKVERVEARWSTDHSRIVTDVELVVVEPLKGTPGARVVLRQPGGNLGRVGQRVEGAPVFVPGEEVVVFLEAQGPDFTVTGLSQGKFRVERATADAPLALQSMGEALYLDPITAEQVSPVPLALPLEVLKARIKAAAAEEAPMSQPALFAP